MTADQTQWPVWPTEALIEACRANGRTKAADIAGELCTIGPDRTQDILITMEQTTPLLAAAAARGAALVRAAAGRRRSAAADLTGTEGIAAQIAGVRALIGWTLDHHEAAVQSERTATAFLKSYRATPEAFEGRDPEKNAAITAAIRHLRPRGPAPGLPTECRTTLEDLALDTTAALERWEQPGRAYDARRGNAGQHWQAAAVNTLARMLLDPTLRDR